MSSTVDTITVSVVFLSGVEATLHRTASVGTSLEMTVRVTLEDGGKDQARDAEVLARRIHLALKEHMRPPGIEKGARVRIRHKSSPRTAFIAGMLTLLLRQEEGERRWEVAVEG